LEAAEEEEASEDSKECAQTSVKNAVEYATEQCKVRSLSSAAAATAL
jgi:hypothetical protein